MDSLPKIAALYVETGGVYYGLPGVDPWDEARDARQYAGPHPVVAHPPCGRWCQLAPVNEARWGARIGDDGGCFAAALKAVRRWGGVLEHPAYSLAWPRFMLTPPTRGLWLRSLLDDGWVTEVSQSAYGHPARKRTWLYLVGDPLELDWRDPDGECVVGAGVHTGQSAGRPRISGATASATPHAFRDVLLRLARARLARSRDGAPEPSRFVSPLVSLSPPHGRSAPDAGGEFRPGLAALPGS